MEIMEAKKHEWRRHEKALYLPKNRPEIIDVAEFNFLTIEGEGNPNGPYFSECITALYAMSYALKMIPKKGELIPKGYFDYTVYPLEGIWDLKEEARKNFNGKINKEDFAYKIMIRQPDFIDDAYFAEVLEITLAKKDILLLNKVNLEKITDGPCIQMMHIGSFDDEAESFKVMEDFADENGRKRLSKTHREIYLSDFRKVPAEKLKTVLRFQVEA